MEKILKVLPRPLILITVAIGLSACVPIGCVPIDIDQRKTIHQTNEMLFSEQKNFEADKVEPVYIPGTGVIGVVVLSVIANHVNAVNERRIKSRTKDVDGEVYKKLFNRNLAYELKEIKWLNLDKSSIKDPVRYGEKRTLVTNFPKDGDTMIYVDLSYQLTPNIYNALFIKANVEAYRKNGPKATLIYKNYFGYIHILEKHKNAEEYLDIWFNNNANLIKQHMSIAAHRLSKAIVSDIQDSNKHPDTKHPTNVFYLDFGSSGLIQQAGYLEGKTDNKYVIRTKLGGILFTDEQVKRKHNWRE
ncbi:MAG: hypothetical protein QM652_07285 [Legionella sp.]|uniref:hypothetical protein n=1 Tax=Legionella sp. TaxID=459 RepID=UPI0039E5A720